MNDVRAGIDLAFRHIQDNYGRDLVIAPRQEGKALALRSASRTEIQRAHREQLIWRVMATLHKHCGYEMGSPADTELWSHLSAARAVVDELFPPALI